MQNCTKLWVVHAPLMRSLQWPAIWSSIKIGQIKKAFYQVWFSSRDAECLLSVFMDTAGTWYFWGEGWEFEAVQVGNDGEVLSSVIFKGELSTGNLCCSFMCWVAVQVCQQTFHIWIFCCWTWLPTHCAHCLQHVWPSPVRVFLSNSMKGRINPFLSSDSTWISDYLVWWLGGFFGHNWN